MYWYHRVVNELVPLAPLFKKERLALAKMSKERLALAKMS